MKLWQNEDTGGQVWAEVQPSERYYSVPTRYEDDIRDGITDEQYDSWFAQSAVVDGVRMGPRVRELTKTHDSIKIQVLNEILVEQSDWIVGYLPGGGGLICWCEDCGAKWSGNRVVWSKVECDKSTLATRFAI